MTYSPMASPAGVGRDGVRQVVVGDHDIPGPHLHLLRRAQRQAPVAWRPRQRLAAACEDLREIAVVLHAEVVLLVVRVQAVPHCTRGHPPSASQPPTRRKAGRAPFK